MYKVEAIVFTNGREALVLDREIELIYTKHGSLIIGMDSSKTFIKCFQYEDLGPESKAFAGNEFDIKLDNGAVIHCDGKWWDGGYIEAKKILDIEIEYVAVAAKDRLKEYFVFFGYSANSENLEKLKSSYDGKVYEFDEYWGILLDKK